MPAVRKGGSALKGVKRLARAWALGVAAALLGLLPMLWPALSHAGDIRLLAGAGLRQPTDKLAEEFTRAHGVKVYVEYGGSGQLMTRYLASRRGDLYMPGALFYINKLKDKGLVSAFRPVVLHTAVVAVNRSKAGLVKGLEDLARPGLKVGLGDPKAMALGRLAAAILKKAGLEQKVAPNVIVRAATVKQLALYVARGHVDAAIISRADAFQYRDKVAMIPIPGKLHKPDVVAAALLKGSENQREARMLMEFLGSAHGRAVFHGYGFLPLEKAGP